MITRKICSIRNEVCLSVCLEGPRGWPVNNWLTWLEEAESEDDDEEED